MINLNESANVRYVLSCLRAQVPTYLAFSRANMSCVLRASLPCVVRYSRVDMPYLLMYLCANVSCDVTCSRDNMP